MSSATIAVRDLQVGMYIQLDLGWMQHPFPLSAFRITGAEQIAVLERLGVERVRWDEARSVPAARDDVAEAEPEADAEPTAEPIAAPPAAPRADTAARVQDLQRAALRRCEAQYHEAAQDCARLHRLLDADPASAGGQATQLAGALRDKMIGAGELCIRLISAQGVERSGAHALNVTVLALLLARALGMDATALQALGTGALLHDIGKLDLPARVHHLGDDFRAAEVNAYRDHVPRGVARARRMGLPDAVVQVIAQHHEAADASGFPGRLPLASIAPAARVVALVNRYDNLCNPGHRAAPLTPHEAMAALFAQQRTRFDADVLQGFIKLMGVYPAGSLVQLSDERHALVVQVNGSRPLRPLVRVHDAERPREEAPLLDLAAHPQLSIRRSLPPARVPAAVLDHLAPRPRTAWFFDRVEGSIVESRPMRLAEAV